MEGKRKGGKEGRKEKEGRGEEERKGRGREGEGCVMALGEWTPLLPYRRQTNVGDRAAVVSAGARNRCYMAPAHWKDTLTLQLVAFYS